MRERLNRVPIPLDRRGLNEVMFNANIGRRFWNANLDYIEDKYPHKKIVADYIANYDANEQRGHGLLLFGEHGTGKTTLLSVLLREALRRAPCSAWFAPMPEVDWFARHRDELGRTGVPVWQKITQAQIVAIDDLGSERQVDWNDCWFEEVVRLRYNEQLVTHVASNIAPEKLFKRFGWLESMTRDAFKVVLVEGVVR